MVVTSGHLLLHLVRNLEQLAYSGARVEKHRLLRLHWLQRRSHLLHCVMLRLMVLVLMMVVRGALFEFHRIFLFFQLVGEGAILRLLAAVPVGRRG